MQNRSLWEDEFFYGRTCHEAFIARIMHPSLLQTNFSTMKPQTGFNCVIRIKLTFWRLGEAVQVAGHAQRAIASGRQRCNAPATAFKKIEFYRSHT